MYQEPILVVSRIDFGCIKDGTSRFPSSPSFLLVLQTSIKIVMKMFMKIMIQFLTGLLVIFDHFGLVDLSFLTIWKIHKNMVYAYAMFIFIMPFLIMFGVLFLVLSFLL